PDQAGDAARILPISAGLRDAVAEQGSADRSPRGAARDERQASRIGTQPLAEEVTADAAARRSEERHRRLRGEAPCLGSAVAGRLPLEAADRDAFDAAEREPGGDRRGGAARGRVELVP